MASGKAIEATQGAIGQGWQEAATEGCPEARAKASAETDAIGTEGPAGPP